MKKRLVALILALTWSTMSIQPPTAIASDGQWVRPMGPCHEQRYRITRAMPLGERQDRNRALVRCVFARFAPAQTDTAIAIATRESSLDTFAWNTSSDCRGTFQHRFSLWSRRVSAYLHERWFPNTWPKVSAFHERANAIVAAKMVRDGGWQAWGG